MSKDNLKLKVLQGKGLQHGKHYMKARDSMHMQQALKSTVICLINGQGNCMDETGQTYSKDYSFPLAH